MMYPKPVKRVKVPTAITRGPAPKAKPRPAKDRVTPELRAFVLNRDRMCVGIRVRLIWPECVPWHQCRDKYGNPHVPNAVNLLTLDHFWPHAGGTRGKRAPSDPQHLVAVCASLNDHGMTAQMRGAERKYMEWLYR